MEAPSLSLPEVFFPPALIQELAEKDQLNVKEKIAYMRLLLSNLEESVRAFKERRFTAFDALVGDHGCERRAIKLLELATSDRFASEVNSMQEGAIKVNRQMKDVYTSVVRQTAAAGPVKDLFHQISAIRFSREMAYLLQCHLLTFAKVSLDAVKETINIDRLERLANGGKHKLRTEDKKRIVNLVQAQLSELSIDFLRNEARQIAGNQSGVLCGMLERVQQIPSNRGDRPIASVCQFYSMQAVVRCLRERRALIVFKKWIVTKEDQPIAPLFYRDGAGGAFVRVPDEEVKKMQPEIPVVVFEGTVHPQLGREQLAACLQQFELGEVTLAEVAQGESLEDVTIPEARQEIESYVARAAEMKCFKDSKEAFIWMDHIYCSSLGDACKGGAP